MTFDPTWILPVILYAETHYRFRFMGSLLYKPEPEVLADAPFFVVPGERLPVLLMVKDADKFPIELAEITIRVARGNELLEERIVQGPGLVASGPLWWEVVSIPLRKTRGWVAVDVRFSGRIGNRLVQFHNDNYRGTQHAPLRVYLAQDPLPGPPSIAYGDAHTHSEFSDDQVEFGSPLGGSPHLARAIGLSFFAVTDHSYDLDDRQDNYLKNDPRHPKWRRYLKEVDRNNRKSRRATILRGEEVSCRNGHGQNVHLLLLGNTALMAGSGDSAERWLRTRSEYSIAEVTAQRERKSFAFAAHPFEVAPLIQRVLLGRGDWSPEDLASSGLAGLQLFNGGTEEDVHANIGRWRSLLLRGLKLVIIAGNDAHGNFSRFRQLGIPFVSMRESATHLFGRWKTGLSIRGTPSEKHLLNHLGSGRSFVTDGPYCWLEGRDEEGGVVPMGSTFHGGSLKLKLRASSTRDFGALTTVRLVSGVHGSARECVLWEYGKEPLASVEQEIRLKVAAPGYVRAEAWTSSNNPLDGKPHVGVSNPIWSEP